MKTLSQLMMCDFVDMLCGDVSKVIEPEEKVKEKDVAEHVKGLIYDYRLIVNPSGVRAVIAGHHTDRLRHSKMALITVCLNLIALGCIEEVEAPLSSIGYRTKGIPKERLQEKLKSELRRLEYERKRSALQSAEQPHPEEQSTEAIRLSFDKEIAVLMTFFKMNIDIRSISAAVYANLVVQAEREIKANKQMLHRMRR